jgi:hypothetical protein
MVFFLRFHAMLLIPMLNQPTLKTAIAVPVVPPDLCSGADKNALNADEKTALEVATMNEQADVAKALEA